STPLPAVGAALLLLGPRPRPPPPPESRLARSAPAPPPPAADVIVQRPAWRYMIFSPLAGTVNACTPETTGVERRCARSERLLLRPTPPAPPRTSERISGNSAKKTVPALPATMAP